MRELTLNTASKTNGPGRNIYLCVGSKEVACMKIDCGVNDFLAVLNLYHLILLPHNVLVRAVVCCPKGQSSL
jgi:hypothetical protein